MSYFDKNKNIFRIIIAILGISLLTLDISNFVNMASSKTDQNLYSDPPTRFYITKDISADIISSKKDSSFSGKIKTGSLLYKVNNKSVKSIDEFDELINSIPENEKITITYFDNKDVSDNFARGGSYKTKSARINKKDIHEDFLLYLNSAVLVGYVEKNGASERAGVRVGDYFIKVNGESFKTALEANKYIIEGTSGNYLNYHILRNNKVFECRVEIVKFEISINYLLYFIVGLVFMALGILFAELRPGKKETRLLGLAFIVIGYYISAFLILASKQGVILYHIYFLFTLSTAFGFPLLIHSLVYFPVERKDMIKSKWIIWGPYIFGILFTVTAILNLFLIQSIAIDKILILLIRLTILIYVLYYFIVLLLFRKHRSKEEAGLSRMINISFLMILISTITAIIFGLYKISSFQPYFLLSLLLLPLSFIYTIGRYKLLGIEFRIRKNIRYILISAIWKSIIISGIFLIILIISQMHIKIPNLHFTGSNIEVLDHPLNPDQQNTYHNVSIILLSIIGALVFRLLNSAGQKYLDKKYFRARFDYRRASTEFAEILDKNISIDDLAKNIISELAGLVHLKKAGIIFYTNEEKVVAQNFYGFNGDSITEYCKVTAKQQILYIKQFKSEFRVDYLDDPMREIYIKCEFRYIVPIRSKEKIIGALLLGDKLSEAPYHREDLEFLNTIAGQISAAVENAYLYAELTQQERIKHELELARRIQLASLPQNLPDLQGLDISGISIPAHEVGGDFYDYLGNNGELTVIVGDVSGKGTSAALYMSKAQGIMRTLHEFNLSPKELFIRSNRLLYKYLEKSSFITAICASINPITKKMKMSRAGHLPMYFFRASDHKIETIQCNGIVLGMTKSKLFDLHLEEKEISFETGDIFLFITDGVIDARNQYGHDFQAERLLSVIKKHSAYSSETIKNEILDAMKIFTGNEIQFDDITIVVIKAL